VQHIFPNIFFIYFGLEISKCIFRSGNIFWRTESENIEKKGHKIFIMVLMRISLGIANFMGVHKEKGCRKKKSAGINGPIHCLERLPYLTKKM